MNALLKRTLAVAAVAIATQAGAQVTFYEQEGFQGRSFNTERQIGNLDRYGFNDRASSAVVLRDRWEVCDDTRFSGRCVVLRPGRYPSLAAMGLNDRVSSVRTVSSNVWIDDRRYAPAPPEPVYDNRRRGGERLYEADVTSVRAVVGPPQQRCWVEREQVVQDRGGSGVPGAIAGALIGGAIGNEADQRNAAVYTSEREATTTLIMADPPQPPAMPSEVIPRRPAAEAIWVGGYWLYNANQHYEWVPGRWTIPPPRCREFVPPHWADRKSVV